MTKTNKTLAVALVTGLAFGTTAALAEGMQHDGRGHHGHHGRMAELFWNKLDQNGDGKVTQDELKADVTSRFSAIDTNKDGKVTQDEVTTYFAAKHEEMKAKFAERLKEADANKDGKWSKDELAKMPEERFSKLDTNGDGFVTQAELDAHRAEREARFQEKRGEHAASKGGKMFSHFDANGDGVVDQSEALKLAEARFSKLDTNGDGAVEQSEFKAGHHHGRGGKHECDHQGNEGNQGKSDNAKTPSTKQS